jgi:hypothetical protein
MPGVSAAKTQWRPIAWSASYLLPGLCLLTCGCAGKYTPVPVSGKVTLDGKPVEGATVYFYAIGDEREGRPAYGATDKDGEFHLSTMGNRDGALRREYKVVIHKNVPSRPDLKVPNFPNNHEGQIQRQDFMYREFEAKGIQPFKNALPAKYGDSKTTPFTCKVEGTTRIDFPLTSK